MSKYIDLANEVMRSGIHLADDYSDYVKLAFSLSTLGEQGRSIFHSLCSYCRKYDRKDADRKFSEAIKNNRDYSIATFVWMCKQEGVDVRKFGLDSGDFHPKQPPILTPKPTKEIDFIPFALIQKSESIQSGLLSYLSNFYPQERLETVVKDYHIGVSKSGETIFPLLDEEGRCRTARIIRYKADGHRVGNDDWVHSRAKRQGLVPADFKAEQCLFGQHLLPVRPNDVVCLTESCKNAVIGALEFPEYLWVAVGCKGQFTKDFCKPLAGRDVLAFSDADAAASWAAKAKEMTYFRSFRLSDWLKDEPENSKRDIADIILAEHESKPLGKPTTIGDICQWLHELGVQPGRVTFNI